MVTLKLMAVTASACTKLLLQHLRGAQDLLPPLAHPPRRFTVGCAPARRIAWHAPVIRLNVQRNRSGKVACTVVLC